MSVARRLCLEPLEDRTLLSGGVLDPSFGLGGEVITTFSPGADGAAHVAFQPDGKLVVLGYESVPASGNPGGIFPNVVTDSFLARYDSQGQLDPTFGTGGKVVTDFRPGAVAIQANGKILVAGTFATASTSGAELARYNPDGSLDTTFGSGGRVLDPTVPGFTGVLVQPDGKIIVDAAVGTDTLAVARYNPDGSPDAGFGAAGKVSLRLGAPGFGTIALAQQADGKLLVVGTDAGRGVVVRFNGDGTLDSTFGAAGQVALDASIFPAGLAVQRDGRILIAGDTTDPSAPQRALLLRLNPNGSVDPTFGVGGEAVSRDLFQVVGVALDSNGGIIVAGNAPGSIPGQPNSDMIVARFTTDGGLDLSFGVNGSARADFGALDIAAGFGIEPDGKLVVVGSTGAPLGDTLVPRHTALARFLADGSSPSLPEVFVTQVYRNLLHRQPDAGGLAVFSGLLQSGRATPVQVVQMIEGSTEYQGTVVADLYTRLLGRPADASGLESFTSFLLAGGRVTQVEAAIFGSPEYALHHHETAGNDPHVFLTALYADVLGRPLDASGEAAFTRALQNGISRSAVAQAVLTSAEAEQQQVEALYQTFLGRSADAGGLRAFTDALQRGWSLETVEAAILGSEECLQRL
jgi:uncharacterized delta-60 repeat protein